MGGGSFTPKLNYHVSCKGGGGNYKKEEARHAGKTRIYKSNRKARILKKEEGNPGIIKRKSYGNQKP